jgi:hypothetical protein
MYRYLLLLGFIMACCFTAIAQNPDTTAKTPIIKTRADSLKFKQDSIRQKKAADDTTVNTTYVPKIKKEKVFKPDTNHSPHTAVIRSLLIPGWGQVYNHRWWKVPLIYTGLGLLGSVIIFNEANYKEFLQLSIYREHGTVVKPGDKYYAQYQQLAGVPDQAIYDANDGYRRNRDLGILGVLGFWGINAIDAYIDAKFMHSYSVDNNLSMHIAPSLLNQQPAYAFNSPTSFIPGLKITFTLR